MSSSKCVFANGSRNGAAMSADFVPGLASHVLPGLEALCVLASMVALVVLTGLAQAAQVAAADSLETFDVAPVWQLDVAQDSAGLIPRAVVNEFTGGRRAAAFPVQELPMRRAMRNTSGVGEQLSWSMRVELGCLCVATDGRIDSTGMSLFPADQVAVDPLNGKLARLRLLNPSASAPQVPAECPQTIDVDQGSISGELYRWEMSPDRSWWLVHSSTGTSLFGAEVPRQSPTLKTGSITEGFTRDGSRYAAVAEREDRSLLSRRTRRWIVISSTGAILGEGSASEGPWDLHLTPDGRYLTFQDGQRGQWRRVSLDTWEEAPLAMPCTEHPYYSADGRTALELWPSPGIIRMIDLTHPLTPRLIGPPVSTQGLCITGALSDNAERAAVQVTEADRRRLRVIVYDRKLEKSVVLLRNTLRRGLQFVGNYLIVGTQRDEVPTYFAFESTVGIAVFDLSAMSH